MMSLTACLDYGCHIETNAHGFRVCIRPTCGMNHGPADPMARMVWVATRYIKDQIREAKYEAKMTANSADEEFHLLADALHTIDRQIFAYEHLFRASIDKFDAKDFKMQCGMVGSVIEHKSPEDGPRGEQYWEIPNPLKHSTQCAECEPTHEHSDRYRA